MKKTPGSLQADAETQQNEPVETNTNGDIAACERCCVHLTLVVMFTQ